MNHQASGVPPTATTTTGVTMDPNKRVEMQEWLDKTYILLPPRHHDTQEVQRSTSNDDKEQQAQEVILKIREFKEELQMMQLNQKLRAQIRAAYDVCVKKGVSPPPLHEIFPGMDVNHDTEEKARFIHNVLVALEKRGF